MQKSSRSVALHCPRYESKQQMTRLGYSNDRAMVLFRCRGCGMKHAFPIATMIRDGIVPPPKTKKTEVEVATVARVLLEYSPSGVYQVGQLIHHQIFDDIGKVIAEKTLNGDGKIVVAFEKSGKRILVHRLATSLEEHVKH
jgi:hypothetical protein